MLVEEGAVFVCMCVCVCVCEGYNIFIRAFKKFHSLSLFLLQETGFVGCEMMHCF